MLQHEYTSTYLCCQELRMKNFSFFSFFLANYKKDNILNRIITEQRSPERKFLDFMNQYLLPEKIERELPQPVYQQIYEQLKRELVLNNHRTGERFFSYRKLQNLYKTQLRTIAAAVDLLIQDGLLEKRSTSGIYVIRQEQISEVGNIWYAMLTEQSYHPFFYNILMGLVKEAEKYGLRIIVRIGKDRKEFLRWFAPQPGEGLVITGDFDAPLLKSSGAKCRNNMVVVGNYDLSGPFGQVTTDCCSRIRESLLLASEYGCRRFGLITGSARIKISRDLRKIISEFAEEHHFACQMVEEINENGLAGMEKLKVFRPDCVILTEPAFSGAWEFMLNNALRSPEDIFLIRYGKEANDNTLAGKAAVELETNSELHGRTALQMLLKGNKEIHKINMQLISHLKGNSHA